MGLGEVLGFSKQATFQATVTVHELLQVPLLHARFRVKWKFKGATSLSSHDSDDNPLTTSTSTLSLAHHALGKRFLHPRSALSSSVSPGSTNNTLPRSHSRSVSPSGRYDSGGDDEPLSGGEGVRSPSRSPPLSPDARTPNPNRTPGPSSSNNGTFAFTSPFSANAETLYSHSRSRTMDTAGTGEDSLGLGSTRRRGGGDLSALAATASGGGAGGGGTAAAHRPEPKGSTTFVPLRQHTATFQREITCPVQVPLRHLPSSSLSASSTAKYQLQPSPVRLSVKQEVLLDDGKREEERLGEVVLDLAQFVGQKGDDARPRRYLLQDCKSNAVLRLTVKMELIETEAAFVAPPLRSGQVPTNSSVAKGLASSQNSPMNRSTASLNTKSRNSSAARLSTSTFSTSHTGSSGSKRSGGASAMMRSNSVSSTGSSRSASLAPSRSSSGDQGMPAFARMTSAKTVNGGRNGRGKKKGWHPPASALAALGSALPSLHPPSQHSTPFLSASHSSHHSASTTGAAYTSRSAPDLIDSIFNRPPRTPSWVGFATASRPTTPGVEQGRWGDYGLSASYGSGRSGGATPRGEKLGDPFEFEGGGGAGRKARERKSAPPGALGGLSADEKERSASGAGKAWSIRSGIERHKERSREKKEQKERDRREGEDGVRRSTPLPPPSAPPGVRVQPPTPQPSFIQDRSSSASSFQTARPPRPTTQPPPPPIQRPASLASSSASARSAPGVARSLSVRWGDDPSASSSSSPTDSRAASLHSSPSTAPTTLPSISAPSSTSAADRRSLRSTRSTESSLSAAFRSSAREGKKRGNPGLGLSASASASGSASSSAQTSDAEEGESPRRPPSQLSFQSVVTPPSPTKPPAGGGAGGGVRGKKEGKKEGKKAEEAPGVGTVDWADSWGGKSGKR
ncbi:hypothetical protein JCM8097_007830 [Rhodosporidiobolus ruineniae]